MSVYDSDEWAAFIDRIRSSPDDDLPRLAMADWLEERGEHERAEFIRVQVELAKPPEAPAWDDPLPPTTNVFRLKAREAELINGRGWGWAGKAVIKAMPLGAHWHDHLTFSRGFIESIRIRGADWVRHADAILRRNPLRAVTVVGWGARFGDPSFAAEWPGVAFTFEAEPHPLADGTYRMGAAEAMWPGDFAVRDANGRSVRRFTGQGERIVGVVTGSPEPGFVTIQISGRP